jgi:hypothetical protein
MFDRRCQGMLGITLVNNIHPKTGSACLQNQLNDVESDRTHHGQGLLGIALAASKRCICLLTKFDF